MITNKNILLSSRLFFWDLTVPMVTEESSPQQVEPLLYISTRSSWLSPSPASPRSSSSAPARLERLNWPSQRSSSISGRSPRLWYGEDAEDRASILILFWVGLVIVLMCITVSCVEFWLTISSECWHEELVTTSQSSVGRPRHQQIEFHHVNLDFSLLG